MPGARKLTPRREDWMIGLILRLGGLACLVLVHGCSSGSNTTGQPSSPQKPVATKLIQPPTGDRFTNSIGIKLKRIPAGEFLMGSPPSDYRALASEQPQRTIKITKPFWLGVFEVTQDQYAQIVRERPSWFSSTGEGRAAVKGLKTGDFPVEFVGWQDAIYFCKQLSQLPAEKSAGRVYRLPTEAEWEYACRAGTKTRYYFGDDAKEINKYAWVDQDPKTGRTHKVGTRPANPFGLHDMVGNVYEWCHDWYGWDYYKSGKTVDPSGPPQGQLHVIRGGSINYGQLDDCRSAARSCDSTPRDGYPHCHIGFRVVCEFKQ